MTEEQLKGVLQTLRSGGIILYPTDTLWGIGCDATNPDAVDRIYRLKRRSDRKSMIILTDRIENVSKYVKEVPRVAWELFEVADKPLTIVLPEARGVAENLIPEEGTIAIRIPDNEFCKKLIHKLGRPLVSTSANISGEPAPVDFEDITAEIIEGVDFVVDKAMEGAPTRTPSSIIKVGPGGEIKIIRSSTAAAKY